MNKRSFKIPKGVFRIRISKKKKNRQNNGQKKKYTRKNNDLQNMFVKLTRVTGDELRCSERVNNFCSTSGTSYKPGDKL